eukprot:5103353-Prymnesium_polylepis.1
MAIQQKIRDVEFEMSVPPAHAAASEYVVSSNTCLAELSHALSKRSPPRVGEEGAWPRPHQDVTACSAARLEPSRARPPVPQPLMPSSHFAPAPRAARQATWIRWARGTRSTTRSYRRCRRWRRRGAAQARARAART